MLLNSNYNDISIIDPLTRTTDASKESRKLFKEPDGEDTFNNFRQVALLKCSLIFAIAVSVLYFFIAMFYLGEITSIKPYYHPMMSMANNTNTEYAPAAKFPLYILFESTKED